MKSPKLHIYLAAGAILLIIAGSVYVSSRLKLKPQLQSVAVGKSDVTLGVNIDGTVDAAQDLGLAFEQGGTVAKINVSAGDKVKQGQVLMQLDSTGLSASLSQAQAAVSAAEAAYQKLINGATDQNINVAQVALASAKTSLDNTTKQQQVAVANAYEALLNSGLAAIPDSGNSGNATAQITGTYIGQDKGSYDISIYQTGSGLQFQYSGLETGSGKVDVAPQALGTKGLFIQFSTISVPANNTWTVSLPNSQSAAFVANNNAYQAALQNQQTAVDAAQNAVNSAQAALDLVQTKARPEDVDAAAAQVSAARAQYQLAQNGFSQSILTAPIDGTITAVDTKVGETVAGSTLAPGIPAVNMISGQEFQVDTFVAENDIGKIKVGDSSQVTLDAYGNGTDFPATVVTIDPASTLINGIATYKVTLQFNSQDDRIREGMGANVTIVDQKHGGVLAVSQSALLSDNGKIFVLVDTGGGKQKKTEVTVGITGLEGNAEVLSGLNEGDKVIYFGN